MTVQIQKIKLPNRQTVILLGVEIDNKLNFDGHASKTCKKAGSKINAIGMIQKNLDDKEKGTP